MHTGHRDLTSLLQFSKSLTTQKVKKEIPFAETPVNIVEEKNVDFIDEETEEEEEEESEEEN